jgi:prepilin-type N-terminal cleavage/methylation domain-containing protein
LLESVVPIRAFPVTFLRDTRHVQVFAVAPQHGSFVKLGAVRRGFTLIELLIVVVIIGIIAAIAVPKFQSTKGKANAAALRADLRNLASAQEAYFNDFSWYTADTAQLKYTTSSGVVITIIAATQGGWSAKATHPQSFPLTCSIYSGMVSSPPFPGDPEGVVSCR